MNNFDPEWGVGKRGRSLVSFWKCPGTVANSPVVAGGSSIFAGQAGFIGA
jgi:hypothetical protein